MHKPQKICTRALQVLKSSLKPQSNNLMALPLQEAQQIKQKKLKKITIYSLFGEWIFG